VLDPNQQEGSQQMVQQDGAAADGGSIQAAVERGRSVNELTTHQINPIDHLTGAKSRSFRSVICSAR